MRTAVVIEVKRKSPIWSVEVEARYVAGFIGRDAKARAMRFATENFSAVDIVEKRPRRQPSRKRGKSAPAALP